MDQARIGGNTTTRGRGIQTGPASPVNKVVKAEERPEVEVLQLMGEYYLLEMMGVEADSALQAKGDSFRMRHPVQKWLSDQTYEPNKSVAGLQKALLEREVPRVYELLSHLVAGELSHVEKFPVRPRETGSESSAKEERDWVRRASGFQRGQYSSKTMLAGAAERGLTGKKFGELASQLFADEAHWNYGYGGKAWAAIATALTHLDLNHAGPWLDHVFDLQHNTGHVFSNKLGTGQFNGQVAQELLDWKFKSSNPVEFLAFLEKKGIKVDPKIARLVSRGANIGLWERPETAASATKDVGEFGSTLGSSPSVQLGQFGAPVSLSPTTEKFLFGTPPSESHALSALQLSKPAFETQAMLPPSFMATLDKYRSVLEKADGPDDFPDVLQAIRNLSASAVFQPNLSKSDGAPFLPGATKLLAQKALELIDRHLSHPSLPIAELTGGLSRLATAGDVLQALTHIEAIVPRGSSPTEPGIRDALYKLRTAITLGPGDWSASVTVPDVAISPALGRRISEELWAAADRLLASDMTQQESTVELYQCAVDLRKQVILEQAATSGVKAGVLDLI